MKNRRTNKFSRRSAHRRRGAVIVEAAMVLPIFLMLLYGMLEYGRYMMLLDVCTNAARDAARYALVNISPMTINGTTSVNTTAAVTTIVTNDMAGQSLASQSIQVYASDALGNNIGTWTSAQPGQWITVKITGNFVSIIPKLLLMPNTLPITAQVVMQVESM